MILYIKQTRPKKTSLKEAPIIEELNNLSGNIKLRLPKSLHAALVRQSKSEKVSLNQLCLMYLSTGISSKNLGADEFNHRLALIAAECQNDEQKLFEKLGELNDTVEALKPQLLHELKTAIDDNKRQMGDFIEILRYIYPIYSGDIIGERLPLLKVPTVKISLRPINDELLKLNEIEELIKPVCENTSIAYGDFDYYVPMDVRSRDKKNIFSIVIQIMCNYQSLEENVNKIRSKLGQSDLKNKFDILIKPSYLQEYTSKLLKEKYGKNN